MRKLIALVPCVLLIGVLKAQLNNFWVQGYNTGGVPNPVAMIYSLDFRGGTITYDTAYLKRFSFREACSVMCDSAGNLLFYSNGVAIKNAEHDSMVNGDNLSYTYQLIVADDEKWGLGTPQPMVIIPHPGQQNLYYLFHHHYRLYPSYNSIIDTLYYSLIDMTQDSGRGAVVDKNHAFWVGDYTANDIVVYGSFTACKHGNGRDWWLMTHKDSSNVFMRFLITPTGILGPYTQAIGDTVNFFFQQSCFSPDGCKYARVMADTHVHLYDFDRCTGLLSNYQHLTGLYGGNLGSVGVCFSPNSRFLYASALIRVYQWDMNAPNIPASFKTVSYFDSTYVCPQVPVYYYLMQAAADGKIYVSSPNSSSCMSVIGNPDLAHPACNVINHGLNDMPYFNYATVPYYPNYYLGSLGGSTCDTLTATINVEKEKEVVRVSPNPASDKIRLDYSVKGDAIFYLTDVSGKIVFQNILKMNNKTMQIIIDKLPSGFYYWKLEGAVSLNGKLIVVK